MTSTRKITEIEFAVSLLDRMLEQNVLIGAWKEKKNNWLFSYRKVKNVSVVRVDQVEWWGWFVSFRFYCNAMNSMNSNLIYLLGLHEKNSNTIAKVNQLNSHHPLSCKSQKLM